MKSKAVVIAILAFFLFPFAAYSAITLDVNLEEMTERAKYVFSGVCTDKKLKTDEQTGREVYIFTFQVEKMIKGEPRDEFQLKTSKTLVDLRKVPVYETGEEVVLFLYGESEFGFSSPVGLAQGRFNVNTLSDGSKVVVNGRGNMGLFNGIEQDKANTMFRKYGAGKDVTSQECPIEYGSFLDMVEELK